VLYRGDTTEDFSVLNVVPDNQFNKSDLFERIYVSIWDGGDESTAFIYEHLTQPIGHGYIVQDENCSFYFTLNYTKIEQGFQQYYPEYILLEDSYTYVHLSFESTQLRYSISNTPFNYDYMGSEHSTYHLKLTIEGQAPIYSYQSAFNDYVLKIENNYVYFNDSRFVDDGYIANNSNIKLEYKYKLQPGLLERKHFLAVIYPWSNVFNTIVDDAIYGDSDITYREKYRKLSGSSIISPFEYSLSINDTYKLYLSYRLNQREYFEEKFEIDYRSTNLDFYYLNDNFDNFVTEYSEEEVVVYYFDENDQMQFLPRSSYEVDNVTHKVSLKNDGNPIVTPNNIIEFYVGFSPAINDERFNAYEFTYNPSIGMNDTLELTYWNVTNGERFDVIPNLNAYNYMNEPKTTFTNFVSHATQVAAFLEEEESLVFDLAGELSWYSEDLLEGIQNGEYLSIYLHASLENYYCLDHITVELHDSNNILSDYTQIITVEELVMWDFDVKIDLPSEENNDLQTITITPIFCNSDEYSEDNFLGIPHFELLEWDDDLVEGDANRYLPIQLKTALITNSSSLDVAYLFNEELQYLSLPEGIEFNWSLEDNFLGDDYYTLYIPETFVDPSDTSRNATFEDGDLILIRYNKPSQKMLKIGIKEIYFNKKPHNYDSLPILSEFMLVNANDSASYEEFIAPYNCNVSLPLTPFDDEFTSSYKNVVFDLEISDLETYAIDGYVDFSHLLFSAPNPNYELTVSQVVIIREIEGLSDFIEFFNSRVWQFTEFETLVSSSVPENDSYQLELAATPLFYNDADQGKWLEYLKIYDENYNYYSAGISGVEYQLLWSPTTQNFTWNPSFNRFQEYWGMEIELPHLVRPNTTLYFEYCTDTSWSEAIDLEYENVNFNSFEF